MFKFTQQEQADLIEHVAEVEADYGQGKMTICQLFENDTLDSFVTDRDMPENLADIDFSFLNRKFD